MTRGRERDSNWLFEITVINFIIVMSTTGISATLLYH